LTEVLDLILLKIACWKGSDIRLIMSILRYKGLL
jgi:hypothetical protein